MQHGTYIYDLSLTLLLMFALQVDLINRESGHHLKRSDVSWAISTIYFPLQVEKKGIKLQLFYKIL